MDKKELIEKYGNEELEFTSYYKYYFSFIGLSGRLRVSAGGDKDNIYHCNIKPKMKLNEIEHEAGITYVTDELDEKVIFEEIKW